MTLKNNSKLDKTLSLVPPPSFSAMGPNSDSVDWSISCCFNCEERDCSIIWCNPFDQDYIQSNKPKFQAAQKKGSSLTKSSTRKEQAKNFDPPSSEDPREDKHIDSVLMKWDKTIQNHSKPFKTRKVASMAVGSRLLLHPLVLMHLHLLIPLSPKP